MDWRRSDIRGARDVARPACERAQSRGPPAGRDADRDANRPAGRRRPGGDHRVALRERMEERRVRERRPDTVSRCTRGGRVRLPSGGRAGSRSPDLRVPRVQRRGNDGALRGPRGHQTGVGRVRHFTREEIFGLEPREVADAMAEALRAVSWRVLGRPEGSVLAIVGTGPQAAAHLRALTAEHDFAEVRIVGRNADAARSLAASHPRAKAMPLQQALRGADAIVTATNSTTPLFPADAVARGAHLMLVGSGNAAASEVAPDLLGRVAAVRVDHRPTCLEESGEIVGALRAGLIAEADVRELGEVVLGTARGRASADEITLYKSVGNGTQDAGLAALLLGVRAAR